MIQTWATTTPDIKAQIRKMNEFLLSPENCRIPPASTTIIISSGRYRWLRIWANMFANCGVINRYRPKGSWFWCSMTKRRQRIFR